MEVDKPLLQPQINKTASAILEETIDTSETSRLVCDQPRAATLALERAGKQKPPASLKDPDYGHVSIVPGSYPLDGGYAGHDARS